MFNFSRSSIENLRGVHSDLILVVARALVYSEIDFKVNEGKRTMERQWELFNRGSSKTLKSKHLAQEDGYAHAVDLVAVGDLDGDGDCDAQDKEKTWDPEVYHKIAAAMKKAAGELGIGIRWGGDWNCNNRSDDELFFDGPHFELYTPWTI